MQAIFGDTNHPLVWVMALTGEDGVKSHGDLTGLLRYSDPLLSFFHSRHLSPVIRTAAEASGIRMDNPLLPQRRLSDVDVIQKSYSLFDDYFQYGNPIDIRAFLYGHDTGFMSPSRRFIEKGVYHATWHGTIIDNLSIPTLHYDEMDTTEISTWFGVEPRLTHWASLPSELVVDEETDPGFYTRLPLAYSKGSLISLLEALESQLPSTIRSFYYNGDRLEYHFHSASLVVSDTSPHSAVSAGDVLHCTFTRSYALYRFKDHASTPEAVRNDYDVLEEVTATTTWTSTPSFNVNRVCMTLKEVTEYKTGGYIRLRPNSVYVGMLAPERVYYTRSQNYVCASSVGQLPHRSIDRAITQLETFHDRYDHILNHAMQTFRSSEIPHLRSAGYQAFTSALEGWESVIETNHLETLSELNGLFKLLPAIRDVGPIWSAFRRGRLLKGLNMTIDFLTNENLRLQFGLLPTIGSVQEAIASAKAVRIRLDNLSSAPSITYGKFTSNVPFRMFGSDSARLTTRIKVSWGQSQNAFARMLHASAALGIQPSTTNLWELVPFSFAIDTVFDVSRLTGNLDNFMKILVYDINYVVYSYQYEIPMAQDRPYFGFISFPDDPGMVKLYGREISQFPPRPRRSKFDFDPPLGSLSQGIIGSLGYQLLK